ncbi:hypothetical protein Tco_1522425 [Tanacetum coccineum]
MLQSIPCSPKCKIIGQILLDHPLSYALTATADLPVETPDNLFVAPIDIETIEVFMNKVGYQGMLIPDAFLIEEIRATSNFKEYEMVFMKGKKRKQTAGESRSPRQSHKITIKRKKPSITLIPPPSDDRERDEIAEATLLKEEIEKLVEGDEDEESYASEFADSVLNNDVDDSGTRLELGSHKENPKKVDDDDEEIEKEKKDDIEIEKEKKDDVEIEKEKKDEENEKENNNDNVEEMDKVVKEKDIVDDVTGSTEIRKEQKQTPIPSPTRSPRNISSSDKIVSEELTATASPTTASTSKASFTTKRKKQYIYFRSKTLPGSIVGKCRRRNLIRSHIKIKFVTHDFFMSKIHEILDHCNKVVADITFAKIKEMITQEMPRLVNLAVNKDREVDPINAK